MKFLENIKIFMLLLFFDDVAIGKKLERMTADCVDACYVRYYAMILFLVLALPKHFYVEQRVCLL